MSRYVRKTARKSPTLPSAMSRLVERLTENAHGCWVHPAPRPNGYGYITDHGVEHLAHRFMYEAMVAEIPDGLQLDHLCRTRACCNPYHLDPVTPGVNSRRGARQGYRAQRCIHGHAKTPENTYVSPKGLRRCRTCKRLAEQQRAAA